MAHTHSLLKRQALGLLLAAVWGLVFAASQSAQAQTETVLYSFSGGSDGSYPLGVIFDNSGNLYGTSSGGGNGYGTVFEFTAAGEFINLHAFNFTDGSTPNAGLMRHRGSLYGTTKQGGAYGEGTVFELVYKRTKNIYSYQVLYNFTGGTDGGQPATAVVFDSSGNLFGTTSAGGTYSSGTIFEIPWNATSKQFGSEQVLHSFDNENGAQDGYNPVSLVVDRYGNLYGANNAGGPLGVGAVFEYPKVGGYHALFFFDDPLGGYPSGNLLLLPSSRTTWLYGGTAQSLYRISLTTGDVFMTYIYGSVVTGVTRRSSGFYMVAGEGGAGGYGLIDTEADWGAPTDVLYSFTGQANGDGAYPIGPVVKDKSGNIYGATLYGGTSGYGTIFKIAP